ncbi:hypothetical protein AC578_2298 [Pseudocercospora eumusae]|uniref:Uncharacterized protein n=1 Tax=Pseudocercospora eumusae TaxID=321146 RepID=A0A139H153_9PEZI|nr:hypothetical protein AC578_2298 [Pseudocercospora eumusae]
MKLTLFSAAMLGTATALSVPPPQPYGHSDNSPPSPPQPYGHSDNSLPSPPQPYGHSDNSLPSPPQPYGHTDNSPPSPPQPYGHSDNSPPSPPQPYGHTDNSPPSPAQPYGHSDTKKRACSQAEVALATGIHLNINGQYSEYNGTVKVDQVEASKGSAADFNNTKGQLQSDIQAGMNIRLFNQQIAPAGNPAIPGLAKYAAAQETEKAQVANLTGNYTIDKPVLDTLKTEIMNGIKLNQANLAAATSECDFTLVFPPENEMGV